MPTGLGDSISARGHFTRTATDCDFNVGIGTCVELMSPEGQGQEAKRTVGPTD